MNMNNLKKAFITELGDGHIHHTYLVETPYGKIVLQKLNKAFGLVPDITAVVKYLKNKISTLEIPTDWRVVKYIDAKDIIDPNDEQLKSAVELVATFHKVIQNFDAPVRTDIHVFPKLQANYDKLALLPQKVIHGDLRFDNILFNGDNATAIIDLDTVQKYTPLWDLANMIFMWCGGVENKPDFEKIEKIKRIYFEHKDCIIYEERIYLDFAIETFGKELHYRFKDYEYFKKLPKEYCDMRSLNALNFASNFTTL